MSSVVVCGLVIVPPGRESQFLRPALRWLISMIATSSRRTSSAREVKASYHCKLRTELLDLEFLWIDPEKPSRL
jgi:hypothetical protein